MKSRILLILVLLAATGCSRVEAILGDRSFGDQLSELSALRDLGLISEKEYKVRRHRINNVMMH